MNTPAKYITAAASAIGFMTLAFLYPAETFIAFTVGWLFFIPAGFIVYMTWAYLAYRSEEKHKIVVRFEPTEAMRSLARREAALHREALLIAGDLERE